MEMMLFIYALTFLIPVNGIILLGMIQERKRTRKLLLAYWKFRSRNT